MSDRERRLQDWERERDAAHTPYLEKPDEMNVGSGLLCWINADRVCGPDCVAFNVAVLGDDPNAGPPEATPEMCTVFAIGDEVLRGLRTLVKLRVDRANETRRAAQTPPVVR